MKDRICDFDNHTKYFECSGSAAHNCRSALMPQDIMGNVVKSLESGPGPEESRSGVYFSEKLDCFCTSDAEVIAEIFRSEKFVVIAYAEHYRAIANRTSIDFSASIRAMDNMPLANEGADHKRLRIEIATATGVGWRESASIMDGFIAALVPGLFKQDSEVDLVADLAIPIFIRLYSLWSGIDMADVADEMNVSQVFCKHMSLNRRKTINSGLQHLTTMLTARQDELRMRPDATIAIGILGDDSLVGSLALSLWNEFSRHAGVPMNAISFPQRLPSTGVPYIERVAKEDLQLAGVEILSGKRVRMLLDSTSFHLSGEENDLLFGKGRHLCLGKPITTAIWSSLIKSFGGMTLRVTPMEMTMRPRDYVFAYPEFARVRIHD